MDQDSQLSLSFTFGGSTTSESLDSVGETGSSRPSKEDRGRGSRGQRKGSGSRSSGLKTFTSQPVRQLPCRTYVSCGTCSFGERCLFLHPRQLESQWPEPRDIRGADRRYPRKLVKHNNVSEGTDALYFPTMSASTQVLDQRGQPLIDQDYVLMPPPTPSQSGKKERSKDLSVPPIPQGLSNQAAYLASLSVWHHLLDSLTYEGRRDAECFEEKNYHTSQPRLPVFVALGKGQCQ